MAARDPKDGRAQRRRRHDPDWEPPIPGRRRVLTTWDDYMALAKKIIARFDHEFDLNHFDYQHPERLQRCPPRFRKPYTVRVAYTEWGEVGPLVVCVGGVANTAMRFNYLASDLEKDFRVVCMDWVGRGRSGWMADQRDYSLGTYAEQLKQLIGHLGGGPVILLGSSLGGSAAIELTARNPNLVSALILNDIGPYIPKKRRKRRSETLARHYVFRDPSDLLRKIGASQKNDGPISDDIKDGQLGLHWGKATAFADSPEKVTAMTDEEARKMSVTMGVMDLVIASQNEVVLSSPYFVPGVMGVEAFGGLRKRDVKVTVLTNSLASNDEPLVQRATRAIARTCSVAESICTS